MDPKLREENDQVFNLNQAMIGWITPNFRRVSLVREDGGMFRLFFVLERDSRRDREGIASIMADYKAMPGTAADPEVEVRIVSGSIGAAIPLGRGVYHRNEGYGA